MGTPVSVDETVNDIPSAERAVEDRMISGEECRIVRQAVKMLSDKYRIPILLSYMEDLPIADIAALLQIPEGTVKTRIHRAKRMLKERLEGQL